MCENTNNKSYAGLYCKIEMSTHKECIKNPPAIYLSHTKTCCVHRSTLYAHICMPKNKHTSTHTILLKLNGDRETTVRQHDSWQGQRKHHGKTQQPPPMNQHILTTAGHHTGHKDCTLTDCWRLPFCASKHVGSGRGCVGR